MTEGWQPIDSAPKDGSGVLVYDEGAIFLAWWDDEQGGWIDTAAMVSRPCEPSPSHWHALPAPPEVSPE